MSDPYVDEKFQQIINGPEFNESAPREPDCRMRDKGWFWPAVGVMAGIALAFVLIAIGVVVR